MAEMFNIYIDESCHLEHDGIPVMVIGAVWCLAEKRPIMQSFDLARHAVAQTAFRRNLTVPSESNGGGCPMILKPLDRPYPESTIPELIPRQAWAGGSHEV